MIDETLTMIPGPTPVHPRILAALGRPTVSHGFPAFVEDYRSALRDFARLCRSTTGQPFIVAGGGTLAMEMAVVNTVAPDERLLVVSHGYFGDRFVDLAAAFGIECDVLRASWGDAIEPADLTRQLDSAQYAAVTITHVDTSTGTASPVEEYAAILRGRPELFILDGVCATAGMDERFDDWGVDVLLTGPQKAIAAPPGVALSLFSERALTRRRERRQVPAYYADVMRWLPIMEDPSRYYSTPCVNEIVALAEALRIVHEEGLDARFARHQRTARAFRAGIEAAGLQLFTATDHLADTLSVVLLPDAIADGAFRKEMASRGIVVAGALGPIAGKAFRLGHMGNIGPAEVSRTLVALEESLRAAGARVEAGTPLAAAAAHLSA